MRENNIVVEPFHFYSYLSFECIKEINHHGSLKITGMVADKDILEYERLTDKEQWISVKLIGENKEEKVFFNGILTAWEVNKMSGNNILTIEIHTGSYLLDIEPHIRSFQLDTLLYSEIIEQCLAETNGKFIMLDKRDIKTDKFLLQYQETNWEFLLRLAGNAKTVLMPEYSTEGKKIYFGYQQGKTEIEIDSNYYKTKRIIEKYKEENADDYRNLKILDMQEYVVISREIYPLGETVYFRNLKMIISKIVTYLRGSELYHEYYLATHKRVCLPNIKNQRVKGISLLANVLKVEKTRVQVRIQCDEGMGAGGCRWFDYSTVYSTPDGTGWYCMPEIGDLVRVVFPDNDENNAYVMSSVHLSVAGERENPDHKSWKNKHNKEILFTPDTLVFRNNEGLILELSDQKGIMIQSNKDIILNADKKIQLTSRDSEVNIGANTSLSMNQGSAKIEMNDSINICGGKIFMN